MSAATQRTIPADERSAGHLVVRQLEAEGVERIYCVPGESYLDVLDGLYDSSISTVVCRQEGGAGYMAVAEGRLTGRAGVVAVTRGPGAANAFISVHTAWQDATPLVVLVGLIPTAVRGREAFQEFDLSGWFGSTAKKVVTLDDADSAARVISGAMHTAVSGRPGPVVVGLPEDVLTQATSCDVASPLSRARPAPEPVDLTELDNLIDAAERPLLVVGGEEWTRDASTAVADWAQSRGIGIAAVFRAYDMIDHDCPNYLGALGYGRSDAVAAVLDNADLQIYVGCVRSDVPSDSYTLGADARVAVIGPDPDLVGHFGNLDLQITSTVNAFAESLAGGKPAPATTPVRAVRDTSWIESARAEFLQFTTPRRELTGADDFVDLEVAMSIVRETLPADYIVTFGAGNHAVWAQRFLPTHRFPSSLGPRNGAMGFGVPAAVAAGLACPDRQVLSVAGDGCFMMNGQELSTAVRYGANAIFLVVDNECFGTIRMHQEREYAGRPSGTGLTNPDFAALAESYGAFGARVETTAQFADAFEAALKAATDPDGGRPAVLHLFTDPAIRRP
ncbi:thiamine pyrophosphate-dependent enzyme [Spelaeicoccus albus]|uniref:Acetolactate synthase-1/2/3 large subunit n=1 Tax=Spelaeicoccus albus TaxID=1280376 RepID=A0A7Z0ABW8_9MICO|nr:thiamine pyrophosphate-dependent enzyme [Spelaeicoccus albus]NYI66823.1 acetolactate synthase-1/2/3 large subunit [Spelaeicoccus albus]